VLKRALTLALAALTLLAALPAHAQARQIVNVYSARHYGALEITFTKFTEETGIEVRLSQGSVQSLLERLRAEGKQTPADVFLSIDAGGLALAAEEGLLQPVESATLNANIPEQLRDPQGRWFGLSQRIRTIMYNPAKVTPAELSTYEALGDPKWKGRLCLRPATHIYTISLAASLIAAYGEEKAEAIVKGWVANAPQMIDSDDRILDTIAAGGCDVAITNHYYLARKLAKDPTFPVKLFWANQGDAERGVHRNVSGMGVTAAAVNKDSAIALLEWMSAADKGQTPDFGLPGGNQEFPANPDAALTEVLKGFETPKIDSLPLNEFGTYQKAAVELLARAGY
jgi:iron(III) transport system substrate-binding protein